jgi:hypothetical protein
MTPSVQLVEAASHPIQHPGAAILQELARIDGSGSPASSSPARIGIEIADLSAG